MNTIDEIHFLEVQREQLHRQMLSSVSHDLKTPLASIIGSLEIFLSLQQQLPLEKQQALLSTALQEAYRLDHFVTNILDMAKLENGLIQTRSEPCDVRAMLQDCIDRMRPQLHGSTLTLMPSDATPIIITDGAMLSRAVSLLIDNALKHGGVPALVEISYQTDGQGDTTIRVRDHGVGIPDGQASAIFDKYTRLSKQDHQKAGTGLGLAICRSIMHLLGGEITAENAMSGGACFSLYLPAAKTAAH